MTKFKNQYYLKCSINKDMFDDERIVDFGIIYRGEPSSDACIVSKDEIISTAKNSGLVKVTLLSVEDDKARIELYNIQMNEKQKYCVYKKDLSIRHANGVA